MRVASLFVGSQCVVEWWFSFFFKKKRRIKYTANMRRKRRWNARFSSLLCSMWDSSRHQIFFLLLQTEMYSTSSQKWTKNGWASEEERRTTHTHRPRAWMTGKELWPKRIRIYALGVNAHQLNKSNKNASNFFIRLRFYCHSNCWISCPNAAVLLPLHFHFCC